MSNVGNLDPSSWDDFRVLARTVIDRSVDFLRTRRTHVVWQPPPASIVNRAFREIPRQGESARDLVDWVFLELAPYTVGNTHPRFWGWVHGSGTPIGMLAELIAGAFNNNVGGRDHAAVYIEREVISWFHELFRFPKEASGLLLSGTSMANVIGLHIAREQARQYAGEKKLTVYASSEAHVSVRKALRLLGLPNALRIVRVDKDYRMDTDELHRLVVRDLQLGLHPACVVATVGTAGVGAVDSIRRVSEVCREKGFWLHVDAAFGVGAMLTPKRQHHFADIELADSLAFDFHKWLHVPYDCGCLLVRNAQLHLEAFQADAAYLTRGEGTAGGEPWYCDFGPELSRGFRALKVWMTLKHYGFDRIGQMVEKNCRQAYGLAERLQADKDFRLLRFPDLNIVCFQHLRNGDSQVTRRCRNENIVTRLQRSGAFVTSSHKVGEELYIRVAICNHRTDESDLLEFVRTVKIIGEELD